MKLVMMFRVFLELKRLISNAFKENKRFQLIHYNGPRNAVFFADMSQFIFAMKIP